VLEHSALAQRDGRRDGHLRDGGPKRVLVVEDQTDAGNLLGKVLQGWGHQVRIVHDGHAALEAAEHFRPDVVLLDIGLPGMDGYQVAERLRARPNLQRTVLIAITGYGQEEDRDRSQQAGFHRHLVKPVDPPFLEELLARSCAHLLDGDR
jgi:CheY-like chemotaxis protein